MRFLLRKFSAVSLSLLFFSAACSSNPASGSDTRDPPPESVARIWNETLLEAIRRDTPRPGVHARNLFHLSLAMYDAWAVFSPDATGYLTKLKVPLPDGEIPYARAEAISYAAYRVLKHRFASGPGAEYSQQLFDDTMAMLGFDITNDSRAGISAAALGNRIARTVLDYGALDGANESGGYSDPSYQPSNPSLIVKLSGTSGMTNPNRWQPLAFDYAETQNGIPIGTLIQSFIGARWGRVTPFALRKKLGDPPYLYYDPGTPYLLDTRDPDALELFRNEAVQLIRLNSQLTPALEEFIDISPASTGNNPLGADTGTGYPANPVTGEPYTPQVVRIGDFGRVLAEFWADGPHSETPPGHWNVVANEASDHPDMVRRIAGTGPVVDRLEWDIKMYFALNGAVHDAAIACWGIKRTYDSARPISFIRYMAEKGQSSDPELPSYNPEGLPLVEDLIELITSETTASGQRHEHLAGHEGEIAVRAWLGTPENPDVEFGGVGWIRAAEWFPYQMKTFISPAFPGYTSGHSTFSRSAAEVLTEFTGSPWFPGGLGEFRADTGAYLKFEYGPSEDIALQWASYYDAADQAGQSRRWGGIHPAMDDFPSRIIGSQIGKSAWNFAKRFFGGENPALQDHLPPLDDPELVLDVPTIPKEPIDQPPYEIPDPGSCTVIASGTYRTEPGPVSCPPVSTSCSGTGGVTIQKLTTAVAPTHGAYFHVDTNSSPLDIEVRVNGTLAELVHRYHNDDSNGAIYRLPRPAGQPLPLCPVQVAVRLLGADEDDACASMNIVRPHFEDVADVMGLTFYHREDGEPQSYASGLAFGDYDNDGDLDLYIPNFTFAGKFFENLGDTDGDALPNFTDVTSSVGLEDIDRGASASFVDFDNDGDVDLFIGRQGDTRLYRNMLVESGTAGFIDATEDTGLTGITARVAGQAWGDFDGDGDLDLYLSTHANLATPLTTYGDRLYRNDDGVFTDITSAALPEQVEGSHPTQLLGFAAMWIDIDLDGDLDLAVTSDFIDSSDIVELGITRPNVMWRNDGPGALANTWVFTDVTDDSGWSAFPDEKGRGANVMGLSTGDINRDGKPDFAFSNIGPNYLLTNNSEAENISFTDISDSAGIRRPFIDWMPTLESFEGPEAHKMSVTWGTHLFDADADGYLDLFYAGGSGLQVFGSRPVPSAFFMNNESNVFTDYSWIAGTLDTYSAVSTAIVDIDKDGFQDLAVANVGGKFRMYLNVTPQNGNNNKWLQVDLTGTVSNRDAYGSIVSVISETAGTQTCFVTSTNGVGSGSEKTCMFGLAGDSEISSIEIRWPDGTVTYPDVPSVDTRILCREPVAP